MIKSNSIPHFWRTSNPHHSLESYGFLGHIRSPHGMYWCVLHKNIGPSTKFLQVRKSFSELLRLGKNNASVQCMYVGLGNKKVRTGFYVHVQRNSQSNQWDNVMCLACFFFLQINDCLLQIKSFWNNIYIHSTFQILLNWRCQRLVRQNFQIQMTC
jgi:hypothetical protein